MFRNARVRGDGINGERTPPEVSMVADALTWWRLALADALAAKR